MAREEDWSDVPNAQPTTVIDAAPVTGPLDGRANVILCAFTTRGWWCCICMKSHPMKATTEHGLLRIKQLTVVTTVRHPAWMNELRWLSHPRVVPKITLCKASSTTFQALLFTPRLQ